MLTTAILLAALAAGGLGAQARDPQIELGVTRFYMQSSGETQVLALAGVPYLFAAPIGTGADAHVTYSVAVRITDDRGTVLTEESFQRSAPAMARIPGATGVEQFRFLLKPGKYLMTISARDSLTGRAVSDSIRLEAYASTPGASDLMLANDMRILEAGDTTSMPGEVARGNFRMRTAPLVRVDIINSNMAFMLEAYTPKLTMGELRLSIRKPDGATVADLPPTRQQLLEGGGLFKGQFSVEGLPDGEYVIHASVLVDGKTSTTQTPFVVSPAEEALRRSVAMAQANRGTDEGFFNSLPDDSLDAAFDVLFMAKNATSRELNVYKKDMSLAAKRRFLIDFWALRDQSKNTTVNEDRIAFYQAVASVNQLYGERGRVGWKTDRGRIHIKFGPPQEVLQRPSDGRAPPYEVWRYSSGKPVWFIFADRSNQGNFTLMKSNELKEPGIPGYLEILTIEVADEVGRWLGVNLENVP
ncbi:MAG TPA: GWxTD domain-containing protein [Gemmatimonadales bacterium]|nr:GWxTD domain-containing protein [Gemmatimonadales bacterium]